MGARGPPQESVTIALIVYREPTSVISQALEALKQGTALPEEVLLVEQIARPDLSHHVVRLQRAGLPIARHRIPDRTLAYARNRAIELSRTNLVAYIDPDAVPGAEFVASIRECFERDPDCAIMAGRIFPRFMGRQPWYTKASTARDVYSLLDLGPAPLRVDRAIGANFAIRRAKIGNIRFDETLGRANGILLGGEETRFSEAVRSAGGVITYWPRASVFHIISASRLRLSWLLKRFYYGGMGRGAQGGRPSPIHRRLAPPDLVLLPMVAPAYLAGYLRGRRPSSEANT